MDQKSVDKTLYLHLQFFLSFNDNYRIDFLISGSVFSLFVEFSVFIYP